MVALIAEHKIDQIPVAGAFMAPFLALATAGFFLITLDTKASQLQSDAGSQVTTALHRKDNVRY